MADIDGWSAYGRKPAFAAFLVRAGGTCPCAFAPDPTVRRRHSANSRLAVAARLGHAVLYLFLIALPLSGWHAASRLGVPVSFFGIQLPAIAGRVQGAPGLVTDVHENADTIILYPAGLHAALAIWHQFVLRDGTLERMSSR